MGGEMEADMIGVRIERRHENVRDQHGIDSGLDGGSERR